MQTVREAANSLRVSPACVYQLIEAGHLPCHRIGTGRGTIRISNEDLATYLSSCRNEAAGKPPVRAPGLRN